MSIKSDRWIREMATRHAMIDPFEPSQVRHGEDGARIVSYGTSSYGYDVRCADEFKIFTNINHAVVDPKAFDEGSFVDVQGATCIIPPNSFALARTVEYFRIPRDVLTICLGKSTYARCFSADTRVALIDGRSVELERMARAAEDGERFFGYGMAELGKVVVVELEAPRLIGRDALLELRLDNGRTVRATPDHEFVLRDCTMRPAAELTPGTSLMPLYRSLGRGYETTFQPMTGHMTPTHRLAEEWNLRHGVYADVPGTHRHHVDRRRTSNSPWNIERTEAGEHIRLRNAVTHGEGFDPREHATAIREASGRLRRDDERYARCRAAQSKRVNDFWSTHRYEGRRATSPQGFAKRRTTEAEVARRQSASRPTTANHKIVEIRELPGDHDVYCLTVPETGNFALDAGVFVSNCGIIVNVTPLEPEWEGHVTLEFSNTTPLPAKIYADEGVAQMLFLQSDEVCETSYADRGGKYQGQEGVTLPRT